VNPCAIVVPCFNEEHRLDARAFSAYAREHEALRFVFVDDGSTDRTLDRLLAMAETAEGRIDVLPLHGNRGKAEAVRRGVLEALEAKPAFFGYWDADLATPLPAIEDFLQVLADRPLVRLVMGARVKLLGRDIRRRSRRHYAGRVFATFASRALDLAVYDTQCGAKVFRSLPETRVLFEEPFLTRWLFDVEILARMRGMETPELPLEEAVVELPLLAWHDVAGSKLRLRDFVRAAGDLARIRRHYGRGARRGTGRSSPTGEDA
jgi:glycosyltransferase involved in cell wall biosynthesis